MDNDVFAVNWYMKKQVKLIRKPSDTPPVQDPRTSDKDRGGEMEYEREEKMAHQRGFKSEGTWKKKPPYINCTGQMHIRGAPTNLKVETQKDKGK